MRFIPLELNIDSHGTFEVILAHLDWEGGDTCLLGFGWYYGSFWCEIGFYRAIRRLFKGSI